MPREHGWCMVLSLYLKLDIQIALYNIDEFSSLFACLF